jgi:hypothetical protein
VPGRAAYAAGYINECKKQINWQFGVEFVNSNDWNALGACLSDYRAKQRKEEYAELRDFLKHNPRYRVPGQSLNRCFGKPREMPFESAYIKADKNGFEAGVKYKDKLPAGCYENSPWDNRRKQ